MAYTPGDIVLFESAVAGKMKFHLCICVGDDGLQSFIFLNSEGGFRDQFEIDCARIPGMNPSATGRTVFDCPTIHRKSDAKLAGLRAKLICTLPKDVAADFLVFARGISSMTAADKGALIAMLEAISA